MTKPAKAAVTVMVGKKRVELVELSLADSLAVDPNIPTDDNGVPSPLALSKIYALAAVRKVDDVSVNPTAGEAEFQRVVRMFTAMEGFQLAQKYSDAFPTEVGEELKNESSAPASVK